MPPKLVSDERPSLHGCLSRRTVFIEDRHRQDSPSPSMERHLVVEVVRVQPEPVQCDSGSPDSPLNPHEAAGAVTVANFEPADIDGDA